MPELPCGKMQPRDQKAGTHLVIRLRLGFGLGTQLFRARSCSSEG